MKKKKLVSITRKKFKRITEDVKAGHEWFAAFQKVNDFMFGELGEEFPIISQCPGNNLIEAIKRYKKQMD